MSEKKRRRGWAVCIPDFPQEQRVVINEIATKNRMKIGPFVGRLLDEQIEKYQQSLKEAGHD